MKSNTQHLSSARRTFPTGKPRLTRTVLTAALAVGGLVVPMASAFAADEALLQQLAERLQKLEQRNSELERQVKALSSAAPAAASDERLKRLEAHNVALQQRVDDLAQPADADKPAEEDGPKFTASLLAVAQGINAAGSATGAGENRLNYRGDITATLSAGSIGDAKGSLFAQVRLGQGTGVGRVPTYTGATNSTAFETSAGGADSFAILAQAYYQLDIPLGGSGFNELRSDRLVLNLGKMDVFGFFDQNEVAGDEGSKFLNNVFVHNPMLDSGGDIAADSYGFAPGLRLGYFSRSDAALAWGASIGVLGSGAGANFGGSVKQPLVIAQFEVSPQQINGEPRGNYRVYAWTNGGTSDLTGAPERHSGVGLSLDQKIGRDWNVFARWGRRTSGDGVFNSALTGGFELSGKAWGRGKDAMGLAYGLLHTSDAYQAATVGGGFVNAGGTAIPFEASGSERIAELYYRIKLNDHLELSPDFQLIQRAGGNPDAATVRVLGLRASLGF